MSGPPQNNLQEVLRRKALSSQAFLNQADVPPAIESERKKSKFKPAIVGPRESAYFTASSPNVASAHTNSSHNGMAGASSVVPPSTPISTAVKRASPEYFVNSDSSPPSPKRLKKSMTDKENFRPPSHSKGVGIQSRTEDIDSDSEAWMAQSLSSKRNPFAILNRTFSNSSSPTSSENSDLLQKSVDSLQKMFRHNQELQSSVTETILRHCDAPSDVVDLIVLKRIRNVLSERITAITHALDAQTNTAQDIILQRSVPETRITAELHETDLPTYHTNSGVAIPRNTPVHWNTSGADHNMDDNLMVPQGSSNDTSSAIGTTEDDRGLQQSRYYEEAVHKLKTVFKLPAFRKNQLEAIVRTLEGRDVLILMPTGGGKSLCYQLPAICDGGKTKGVDSLRQKRIDVVLWSSETTNNDAKQRLCSSMPKPRLLYITPEKLRDSDATRTVLTSLHRANHLARFVIDEAHVISTWGQDFRDAYRDLISLRTHYPNVPIMALTATANHVTIEDIKKRLQLQDCIFLKSSFNRKNLSYTITNKRPTAIVMDIIKFIKEKYRNQTGIIYCLARKTCEKVAKKLREGSLIARHYHAGMSPEEKDTALNEWRIGRCNIIVATIAFGMGIDKPDVRFVIHHDLPKSLDGYYQETGRAGRDGKPSDCLLYYSFSDFFSLKNMIEKSQDGQRPQPETIDRQLSEVRKVVAYCSNLSDCRRVQLLQHFGEKFDKAECEYKCDNCNYGGPVEQKDLTATARIAVQLVRALRQRNENITLDVCKAILSGSKASNIINRGFDNLSEHGSTQDLPRELIELMLQRIVSLDILAYFNIEHSNGYHSSYIKLGPNAQDLASNKLSVVVDWRPRESKTRKGNQPVRPKPNQHQREHPGAQDYADDTIEEFHDDCASLDDGVEVDIFDPPVKSIDPTLIYTELCELRAKLARSRNLSEEDILDHEVLQMLSVSCPTDATQFKETMKMALTDRVPEVDLDRFIDTQCSLYGETFLRCIRSASVGSSG